MSPILSQFEIKLNRSLNSIDESGISRRDFLRKAISGGTAAATGKWDTVLGKSGNPLNKCKQIFNQLTDKQKESLDSSLFSLVNTMGGAVVKNGIIYSRTRGGKLDGSEDKLTEIAPIEALFGRLASDLDKWGDDAPSIILSGASPSVLNTISPQYFNELISQMISKFGIEDFVDNLSTGSYNMIGGTEGIFSSFSAALHSRELQKYTGVTPEMLAKAEEGALYLQNLVDGGILSKEQAIEWKQTVNRMLRDRPAQQQRNKEMEEKRKAERSKREREAKEEYEYGKQKEYLAQDDRIYGSSMHQPFESKLNKALNSIYEGVF
jgi:hypothetical protein